MTSRRSAIRFFGSSGLVIVIAYCCTGVILGACSQRPPVVTSADRRFAGEYKAEVDRWSEAIQRSPSLTGDESRFDSLTEAQRRDAEVGEFLADLNLHEGTIRRLEALGSPPDYASGLVAAANNLLRFLASYARDRHEAAINGDEIAVQRACDRLESEIKPLTERLQREVEAFELRMRQEDLTNRRLLSRP